MKPNLDDLRRRYPPRARVTFYDDGRVGHDDQPRLCTGLVNGDPMFTDDGPAWFIPLWVERVPSKHAASLLVPLTNIVAVGAPE